MPLLSFFLFWISRPTLSFILFLNTQGRRRFDAVNVRVSACEERVSARKESAVKPGSVVDSHSSGMRVAAQLKRPTRKPMWATCSGREHRSLPYLVLLQVGFAVPLMLPSPRCALTAPFHPYRRRLRVA